MYQRRVLKRTGVEKLTIDQMVAILDDAQAHLFEVIKMLDEYRKLSPEDSALEEFCQDYPRDETIEEVEKLGWVAEELEKLTK